MKKIGEWWSGPKEIRTNFYTYSPFSPVPLGDRSAFANKVNTVFLAPFLRKMAKKLTFEDPILLIQRFNSGDLIGLFDEKISCYLCVDEYSYTTDPTGRNQRIVEIEKELLLKVDLVFATSQLLCEDKKRHNENTFWIPNAADIRHFQKALLPETEIPLDIKSIPGPILGLIGTSPARIDYSLLEYLARAEPGWAIVLIGYLECPEIDTLRALNNVYFLGWRDFETIPNYIKAFDVCLIPFKVNNQTNTMNPYKLHEYVAASKPVVSTALFEVKKYDKLYPEIIYVANTNEEFRELIKQALSEDSASLIECRQSVARKNTWEKRLEDISVAIYAHLQKSLKPNDKEVSQYDQ